MTGHGKEVCACGAVIRQCRCMQEHGAPRVVQLTCSKCERDGIYPVPQPTEAEKEKERVLKLRSVYETSEEVYRLAEKRYNEAHSRMEEARMAFRAAEVARNEAYDCAFLATVRHNQRQT